MAELPLVRQRSVQQQGGGAGYQNVSFTPDDYGAGFGRALQQIGQTGQDLARTLKARADETRTNDALNFGQQANDELRKWMLDPQDGILAQTGGKAMGSGGQATVVVDDIKKRYLDKIDDPETRDAFEKIWARESEQAKDQAARHELSQLEVYKSETNKAVVLGSLQDAYNSYNDPAAIKKAMETSVAAIRANSAGMSPEMLKLAEQDAVSGMHLAVISRWAVENPAKGAEYYREHKDQISGKDHVAATQFIQPALDNQAAQENVAQFFQFGGTNVQRIWPAVEFAESGSDPNAESEAGAAGVAQIIPDTARGIALQLGRNDVAVMSDPEIKAWLKANPEESRKFGQTYLGDMLKQFGGDIEAGLVAYNGGPDNAEAFLKHNAGVPPGQRDYNVPGFPGIKSQSEAYVNKILGRLRGSTGEASGGWMTPENWSLKNFTPDDLLAPTAGGRMIDARAATALDNVAEQMKAQFPGFRIKVNEPRSSTGVTAGRRRGASDAADNPHLPNSLHVKGKTAIDVQIQGWNDTQKATFLSLARQAGFGGIGFYGPNGHLHIDMGNPRKWGRVPEWARAAMQVPVGSVPGAPVGQALANRGGGGTPPPGSSPLGMGSFYVGTDTPDQLAFLEYANSITDASVRERTLALGRTEIARQEGAAKQADAANKTMLWEHVVAGGSTMDAPPQLLVKVGPEVLGSMRAFEEARAKGGVVTDEVVWTDVMSMTPEQLIQTDPYSLINSLAKPEYDRLLELRRQAIAAKAGDPTAKKWAASQATRSDLMREYSVTTGWDKDSEEMVKLSRKFDEQIALQYAGKPPGQDTPTAVEMRDILDKLLIEEEFGIWERFARGASGAKPLAARDVTPEEAENFIAAPDWEAVQYDDQIQVMETYRQAFRTDPTPEVAVDIYNRAMRVWLGATPDGPEEEQELLRSGIEMTFQRKLTDAEFEAYYGRWLLTFLGRE